MRSSFCIGVACAAVVAACPSVTQAEAATGLALTVYSQADPASFDPQQFVAQQSRGRHWSWAWSVPGFGVVRQTRRLDLDAGRNTVAVTDVAAFIDPTSVTLEDLTAVRGDAEPVSVLDQSFAFDLVSPQKLLQRFVDRDVTVRVPGSDNATERVSGTLLSATHEQLVLQTDDGLRLLRSPGDVELDELPDDLVTRPTLTWRLDAPAAGPRELRTSYQTRGLTWRADYALLLADDQARGDLSAWVTLMNVSGAGYDNARLKLVAGDVQKINPMIAATRALMTSARADAAGLGGTPGFQQKSFGEYHLYTLPRPATLPANSTQQLTLFPGKTGLSVEKRLVFDGLNEQTRRQYPHFNRPHVERDLRQPDKTNVDVYLRLENEEETGLGLPLPAGKVRVYQRDDADGAAEFVGEDVIGHTPRGREVLVRIGSSFDVTAQRKQTEFRVDLNDRWMEEEVEIEVRNAKDEAVRVIVREHLFRWVNAEVLGSSHDPERVDSRTVHFPVEVPAEGPATVTYTTRYTW